METENSLVDMDTLLGSNIKIPSTLTISIGREKLKKQTVSPPSPLSPPPESKVQVTTPKNGKRVKKACGPCSRSHYQCDEERPCKRCIARGISEECQDGETKKRGRKRLDEKSASAKPKKEKVTEPHGAPVILDTVTDPSSLPLSIDVTSPDITLNSHALHESLHLPLVDIDLPTELQKIFLDLFGSNDKEAAFDSAMREIKAKLVRAFSEDEANLIINTAKHLKDVASQKAKELALLNPAEGGKYWRGFYNPDAVDNFVKTQTEIFNDSANATPVAVFDRVGIIYYVSPSYKRLTSWNVSLLNPLNHQFKHSLFEQFSPAGLKDWVLSFNYFIAKQYPSTTCNHFMFNTAVRDHSIDGKYIEGTMMVSTMFDSMFMPLMFVGTFLPKYVAPLLVLPPKM